MTTATTDLAVIEAQPIVSVDQVCEQVQSIQQLMQKVMQEGQHYGAIPGCGDKPTLLQPGAQKLALSFGFAPEYTVERNDLPKNHREYAIVCRLTHRKTGSLVGEGVGNCSTMEAKYRFRTENTGQPVPQEYWNNRDANLLGGPTFSPKKIDSKWVIVHRVEHTNPADHYNTVVKMAKKRAFVDAVLTATAASDIFTQDLEDMGEVVSEKAASEPVAPPVAATPPTQPKSTGDTFTITAVNIAKEGTTKNGKPWKRYAIETAEGKTFSTFSESHAALARSLIGGAPATITAEANKYDGLDLKSIAKAAEAEPVMPRQVGEVMVDAQIHSVESRTEQANGKEHTVYTVDTNFGRFGTFDHKIAGQLSKVAGENCKIGIVYRETLKGNEIVELQQVPF